MKKTITILVLCFALLAQGQTIRRAFRWPVCRGKFPCHACKNCKYCKYCNQKGGTCGVCNKVLPKKERE